MQELRDLVGALKKRGLRFYELRDSEFALPLFNVGSLGTHWFEALPDSSSGLYLYQLDTPEDVQSFLAEGSLDDLVDPRSSPRPAYCLRIVEGTEAIVTLLGGILDLELPELLESLEAEDNGDDDEGDDETEGNEGNQSDTPADVTPTANVA